MNDALLQFLFTLLASFGGAADIPPPANTETVVTVSSTAVTCHLEYTDERTLVALAETDRSRNVNFVLVTSSATNGGKPDSQDGELEIEPGGRTPLVGARFRPGEQVTASLKLTWEGGNTDCSL